VLSTEAKPAIRQQLALAMSDAKGTAGESNHSPNPRIVSLDQWLAESSGGKGAHQHLESHKCSLQQRPAKSSPVMESWIPGWLGRVNVRVWLQIYLAERIHPEISQGGIGTGHTEEYHECKH
jgi:hypothetical protein